MHASPPPYLAAILENLESRSNEDAYVFLADGERVGESATYSQMRRRVFNFARLLRRSFPPGSRVVLALPPGVAFAVAFIGGLLSGCILVPVKPPGMRASRWRESLDNCLRDCAPAAIVTTPTYLDEIAASLTADPTWRDIQWIAYQHDDSEASPLAEFPGEGEIAFIQYTSGSTSAPKGVRVSFRNLMANAIIMRDALGQSAETVFVSWLPLYHDMGLIGGVLQSAFLGSKYVFFAPANFLQKPERWLRAISAYRATITASPNFGFQHCVDRIDVERLGPLDLSSLSGGACNGAEPVSAATIERFVEKFARFGVGDDFIRPVYGMAEATLMVSAAPRTEPVQLRAHVSETAVRSSPVVSCGFVRGDQEAIIVDPDAGARRPDGAEGEIWLRGENVATGYWRAGAEDSARFNAYTRDGRGPYLRTGDLGFFVDGQIHLTGRLKELIIIRGRNLYPPDIEDAAARCEPAVARGSVAAFSAPVSGEERLVIVAEVVRSRLVDLDPAAVLGRIRAALFKEFEATLHDLVLLPPAHLLKTSSGKIRRKDIRARYMTGDLPAINLNQVQAKKLATTS